MHTCTREHAPNRTKEQERKILPYFSYNEILAEIIVPETENLLGSLSKQSVTVSWRKTSDCEN